MFSTQIQTLVMFPGAQVEEREEREMVLSSSLGSFLEDCRILYSVESGKIVSVEDIRTNPFGGLLETIFGIYGLQELGHQVWPDASEWVVDWLDGGGWEVIGDLNMKALYEVSRAKIDRRIAREKEKHSPSKHLLETPYFNVEFIACWQCETSTDWETSITEVEAIDFLYEGKVVEDVGLLYKPKIPVLNNS